MKETKWPDISKTILSSAQILFLALRACDVITWPWWLVASPVLVSLALYLVAAIIVGLCEMMEK